MHFESLLCEKCVCVQNCIIIEPLKSEKQLLQSSRVISSCKLPDSCDECLSCFLHFVNINFCESLRVNASCVRNFSSLFFVYSILTVVFLIHSEIKVTKKFQ